MIVMPFINSIGRSVQDFFTSKDEAHEKKVRIDRLHETIQRSEKLRILSKSDGWMALLARHDVKIKALQAQLERAEPGELKLIQAQIAVLRSVASIEPELTEGNEAVMELDELE